MILVVIIIIIIIITNRGKFVGLFLHWKLGHALLAISSSIPKKQFGENDDNNDDDASLTEAKFGATDKWKRAKTTAKQPKLKKHREIVILETT